MGDSVRKAAFFLLFFGAFCIVAITSSVDLEAHGPIAVQSSVDDLGVGGEPGEDPHLRVVPTIESVEEYNHLGRSAGGPLMSPVAEDEIAPRGAGPYARFRSAFAWRMMLQALLWTMHR
jgi:hypothetical protein